MKKPIFLAFAVALFFGCSKDAEGCPEIDYREPMGPYDGYFWNGSQGRYPLEVVFDKHFVIFKEADAERILRQMKEKCLFVEEGTYKRYLSSDHIYFPDILKDCVRAIVTGGADPKEIEGMVYSTHLYRDPNGLRPDMLLCWSNYVYVGIESEDDLDAVEEYADKLGAYMIRESYSYRGVSVLCTNESAGNHVEIANRFHESGKFRYGFPELMSIIFY